MKKKKFLVNLLLALVLVFGGATSALAMYYPDSFYDAIAYSWEYEGPVDDDYNCLAYAIGNTSSWVWPWGANNPNSDQVDAAMSSWGYDAYFYGSPFAPDVISYVDDANYTGTDDDEVVHFAKAFSDGTIISKWGQLELIKSDSWSPFKTSGGYGPARKVYQD